MTKQQARATCVQFPASTGAEQVNAAHARQRGPGERVKAQLKNWRVLRMIRSCPNHATKLVAAVQPS